MKEIPLILISYLNLIKKDDDLLLKNYPEIHERCNKLIFNNINKIIKYRKCLYFKYIQNLDYPIIKYYK